MSTVAKKVIMGSGAGDSAYEIDQSILLNSPDIPILYRQAAATGNRRTFTYSCWVKRAKEDAKMIVSFGNAGDTNSAYLAFYNGSLRVIILNSSIQAQLFTNAVFRDFSSWYHIVLAVDTTQGTAANRLKLYVNGTQITSFSTEVYPSQNYDTAFSLDDNYLVVGNNSYYISDNSYNGGIDGYIAEVHILDGVAKAPSDFGETNEDTGQWVPKEYEGGSYGTNGFYGKFVSGAIGTDSSGTGNTMTVANLSNSDVVTDTPTNNCMTLNPLDTGSSTLSEGNLTLVTSNHSDTSGTMRLPNTGKWYWEVTCTTAGAAYFGIYKTSYTQDSGNWVTGSQIVLIANTGQKFTVGSSAATYMSGAVSNGDVVGVAVDCDNGKIFFADSNTWGDSGNPATGSNPAGTFTASDGWKPGFYGPGGANAINISLNFGQKTFSYTPPSGFSALTASNLPEPAIPLPSAHFNTVIWTGNDANNRTIPVGFAPDLTWFKQRTGTNSLALFDTVRGNSNPNGLSSNSNSQEFDWTGIFKGHTSNGFTVDSGTASNHSSNNYVGWNWKANGSGSTNNDGNQASVVSANQAAGFSIATYTGTGSYATYGHGLGVIPEVTLTKSRSATGDWYFVTTVIDGSVDYIILNAGDAKANGSATASTTSVFYSNYPNNQTVVAYNFASIPGFSKIGNYTGNGSATAGPFVNLGFKPAFVMRKITTGSGEWWMQDIARTPNNISKTALRANTSAAEVTSGDDSYGIDILSNGFRVFGAASYLNGNGQNYLYMAFAESPFKTANAH